MAYTIVKFPYHSISGGIKLMKRINIFALLVFYIFTTGCAALWFGAGAAGGAAGVVWHKGRLEETVPATVPQVHRAAIAAMRELRIMITEQKSDSLTSKIRGELADGKNVWIDAESTGSSTTKISIRVGILGDKDFSMRIRDSIKRHQ
jgi:hypothetical protein